MNELPDNDLGSQLQAWLDQIMHIAMRDSLLFARHHGLSMPQMVALAHVARHGRCSVSDLATILGVSNAAASQLLERLVQQGLVLRIENPADRRSKQLTLTEKGHVLLHQTLKARQQWLKPLLESLTLEEQEKISGAMEILLRHTPRLKRG